jgi:5' nucleotidase, deoxy (Pyrimidine), cytosolic type C protein (NT5C)
MTVRIGFDMDGVLADFAGEFRHVETRLFGGAPTVAAEAPEVEAQQEEAQAASQSPREMRRRRDAVWNAIHRTPDFWTTLKPLDPGAVRRIHTLMVRHRWEVFFITQRPATEGQTVQRQTQRWLVEQGFDLPSVLVISGSRGAAAGALRLNFHVDDSAQNCLDVASESKARPLLIVPEPDAVAEASAKRLKIGVVRSIGEALDALEQRASAGQPSGLLNRLSKIVGWD